MIESEQRMKDGMKRMLEYPKCLHKDTELRKMCEPCEAWYGDEHDYHNCVNCQAFKFYCETKEWRFADTFCGDFANE